MLANMFLPKLQQLADQQSPTMLELIQRKLEGGNDEDATDSRYLRGAFAVIAEHYITGIDQGDIRFANDSEKGQFMWLLQLLVDYATSGGMEDLIPSQAIQDTRNRKPDGALNGRAIPELYRFRTQSQDRLSVTADSP